MWAADDVMILLYHSLWFRTQHEVEVKNASNDLVGEMIGVCLHVHAIAVPQEDTVCIASRSKVKIEWV